MEQIRKDLRSFDLAKLEEMRAIRAAMYRGRDNWLFWDELESIITRKGYKTSEWTKIEKDGVVVLGDVWEQPIGRFWYDKSVHEYAYLYTESTDVVIDWHGHNRLIQNGKNVLKTREWYTFPDGRMEFCPKDEKHRLVNTYGKPIYVISTKITSCPRSIYF